jgi:phosphoribosyl 1,2-cyclic phosphodiesterase
MPHAAQPADLDPCTPQADLASGCSVSLSAHTVLVPWQADGLRLHVLGSGSQGNASVVECPDGLVLVDAGLNSKQVGDRMAQLGLAPARIRAILVTHEHADHIAGLRVLSKKYCVPVYASDGTCESEAWRRQGCPAAQRIERGGAFEVCGIRVTPFPVPHDAAEPLGFRFERAGDAVAYCTDLGSVTNEAAAYLADARILALESNHDPAMLRDCPRYPAHLKARIGGPAGHLSNAQAAEALPLLATARTQTVVGMHISQHTNLPSLCREALLAGRRAVAPQNGPVRVMVASQSSPLSCL